MTQPINDAPMTVVRYLDCVLVIAALPFVVLAGVPLLGYTVGAGAWLLSRLAGAAVERRARTAEYRRQIGLNIASQMARAWLVGLAILAVGLAAEREDGLTAAVVVLVAFTVYFALALVLHRPRSRR
jgi:hypothetical protein